MKLNTIITEKRKELNLTICDLAKKINVSERIVESWENGNGYPSKNVLPLIEKVLDLEIESYYNNFKNEEINYQSNYNYQKIAKYKSKVFIAIVAWFFGMSLLLYGNNLRISDHETLGIIIFVLGLICTFGSIILFALNNLNYTSLYKEKYHIYEYDKAGAYWSSFYYISLISILLIIPINTAYKLNENYIGIVLLNALNIVTILLIFRKFNFKLLYDKSSKIMFIIITILTLLNPIFGFIIGGVNFEDIALLSIIPLVVLSFVFVYRQYYVNK